MKGKSTFLIYLCNILMLLQYKNERTSPLSYLKAHAIDCF